MKIKDIPGWFPLRGAGLNLERRKRVLGQLKDDRYPIKDIKNICLRIFPDVHTTERSADHGLHARSSNDWRRNRSALIVGADAVDRRPPPAEPPQCPAPDISEPYAYETDDDWIG